MKLAKIITAALIASTSLSSVPLYAGGYGVSTYGSDSGRYDRGSSDRDRYGRDGHDHDHDHDRYEGSRRPREVLELIGRMTARGPEHENDLIDIGRGRRYNAIQFQVDRGDVKIEHIRITFGDDSAFEPTVQPVFREGERTCKINLPGSNREVKRVRIHYHSLTRGSAVIEVLGVL